jgi:dethiobiotin synthetase
VSAPGLFVTGTDTGVGKTLVACTLVRALRAAGIDAGAMKPVETGVGEAGPLDALALRRAAGDRDPLDDVCPYRFALPAAPSVAARHAARRIELELLRDAFDHIAARRAAVVVEGAGGLLVPLAPQLDMAGLAASLALPVVVVARASLGTINHTLLTLEAARARDLEVAGVVVSFGGGPLSAADEANLGSLRDRLGRLLIGEIPPLAPGQAPPLDAVQLPPLLDRLR